MAKVVKGKRKGVRAVVKEPKPFGWDHGMKTSGKKKRVKKI